MVCDVCYGDDIHALYTVPYVDLYVPLHATPYATPYATQFIRCARVIRYAMNVSALLAVSTPYCALCAGGQEGFGECAVGVVISCVLPVHRMGVDGRCIVEG